MRWKYKVGDVVRGRYMDREAPTTRLFCIVELPSTAFGRYTLAKLSNPDPWHMIFYENELSPVDTSDLTKELAQ